MIEEERKEIDGNKIMSKKKSTKQNKKYNQMSTIKRNHDYVHMQRRMIETGGK